MLLSLAYLAVRTLLRLLVPDGQGEAAKDLEIVVLRHELNILRRQVKREGCTNSIRSCCRLKVFVQQPAKSISPTHRCVNRKRRPLELFLLWCLKLQNTVRSLSVVMMNVDLEDAPEVASGVDEQPVQALRPHGSDPSLTDSVGTRRPDGSTDHLRSVACKNLIEGTTEFVVAVMDEKPQQLCPLVEVEGEVPRLLGNPGSVGVGGATGEMDAPCGELDEHQNVDPLQPDRFDGEEVARHHARSLLGQKLPPGRAASPGRRPQAAACEQLSDRRGRYLDPEL
jgi:hypothetical protein